MMKFKPGDKVIIREGNFSVWSGKKGEVIEEVVGGYRVTLAEDPYTVIFPADMLRYPSLDDVTPDEWDKIELDWDSLQAYDLHKRGQEVLKGILKQPDLNAHYHTTNDPYRFALDNNLGPIEMHIIKYVTRHKKKGGKRDLEAAKLAIDRLIKEEYPDEAR